MPYFQGFSRTQTHAPDDDMTTFLASNSDDVFTFVVK